jgi:hypothetical protein
MYVQETTIYIVALLHNNWIYNVLYILLCNNFNCCTTIKTSTVSYIVGAVDLESRATPGISARGLIKPKHVVLLMYMFNCGGDGFYD